MGKVQVVAWAQVAVAVASSINVKPNLKTFLTLQKGLLSLALFSSLTYKFLILSHLCEQWHEKQINAQSVNFSTLLECLLWVAGSIGQRNTVSL